MAVTNLHKARIAGKPVTKKMLKPGIKANFPSGSGGVVLCTLKRLTSDEAVFESENTDWPITYVCKFNEPDLTEDEILQISDALKALSGMFNQTPEQRTLLNRAEALGYVTSMSYTQYFWSDFGISRFQQIRSANVA